MASYMIKLAALAAVIAPVFGAPTPETHHVKIRNPQAEDVVPDSYIVVYNADVEASTMLDSVSAIISKRQEELPGVGETYEIGDFKGFQITATVDTINEIASAPEVAYVEKDQMMYANALVSQTGAPYGLARLSNRSPGSTTYTYDDTAGSGATVYVIDTGVLATHNQFGGRASMGANFITGSANTDENGHGTHCAGTIAGTTYGIAKRASIVGVKVLDADGSGSNSGVISGVQWVANNAGARSVASMSLGGSNSAALNSAVANLIAAGVTTVVAAGNDNADASNYSPANAPNAITVAAISSTDARASFSNYGAVIDVFAPGVSIISSWIGGNTATNTISGTSMACPHIAGLAAYLIALEGLTTPASVISRIRALATSGLVTNALSANNLIGYNGRA